MEGIDLVQEWSLRPNCDQKLNLGWPGLDQEIDSSDSTQAVSEDDDRPRPILDPGPVRRPDGWLQHVNEPLTEAEVERLRECLRRGRPLAGDVGPRTILLVEVDELDEVLPGEGRW